MTTPDAFPYDTHLDIRFGALEDVDVPALVDACSVPWYNQTLCRVNASVVRLGVVHGEYHWHKHDDDDEFFYVVPAVSYRPGRPHSGAAARQGFVVPKGVMHRTRAPERTVILMVENAGIVPTGADDHRGIRGDIPFPKRCGPLHAPGLAGCRQRQSRSGHGLTRAAPSRAVTSTCGTGAGGFEPPTS